MVGEVLFRQLPMPPRSAPLVSCIMPTRDRREHARNAISYFVRQRYPLKELVILDDGIDRIADIVTGQPGVRYVALDRDVPLGVKRNIACDIAEGELIAHLDDDDWYSPDHLTNIVAALAQRSTDICGTNAPRFLNPEEQIAYCFRWTATRRLWLAGCSLGYRKSLWKQTPFPAVPFAEDTAFVWNSAANRAGPGCRVDIITNASVVGIIHRRNTVPKQARGPYWRQIPIAVVARQMGRDFERYIRTRPDPIPVAREDRCHR